MRPRVSEFNLIEVCFTLFNGSTPPFRPEQKSKKNVGCILMNSKFDDFLESNKWNSQHYLWSFFFDSGICEGNLWALFADPLGGFSTCLRCFQAHKRWAQDWIWGAGSRSPRPEESKWREVSYDFQQMDVEQVVLLLERLFTPIFLAKMSGSSPLDLVMILYPFGWWTACFCFAFTKRLHATRCGLGIGTNKSTWRTFHEVFHLTSLDLLLVKGKQPFLKEATTL